MSCSARPEVRSPTEGLRGRSLTWLKFPTARTICALRILLLSVLLCVSLSAKAQAAPRRAVVVVQPGDKLGTQLRSELLSAGFEPLLIPPPDAVVPRSFLESALRQYQAVGVLQVVAGANAVQVWTWSSPQQALTLSDLIYQSGEEDTDRSLVAVRAVEALREGAKAPSPAAQASGDRPAPLLAPVGAPHPRSSQERRTLFLGGVGAAVLVSPGGLKPLANADLQAQVLWPSGLLLRAAASLPLTSSESSSAQGTSDASATLLAATVGLRVGTATHGYGALGLGLLRFQASGTAVAPNLAHADSASAGALLLNFGGRIKLLSSLGMRGDVALGYALPELSVRHAQTEVATFGRPLLSVGAGLDLLW